MDKEERIKFLVKRIGDNAYKMEGGLLSIDNIKKINKIDREIINVVDYLYKTINTKPIINSTNKNNINNWEKNLKKKQNKLKKNSLSKELELENTLKNSKKYLEKLQKNENKKNKEYINETIKSIYNLYKKLKNEKYPQTQEEALLRFKNLENIIFYVGNLLSNEKTLKHNKHTKNVFRLWKKLVNEYHYMGQLYDELGFTLPKPKEFPLKNNINKKNLSFKNEKQLNELMDEEISKIIKKSNILIKKKYKNLNKNKKEDLMKNISLQIKDIKNILEQITNKEKIRELKDYSIKLYEKMTNIYKTIPNLSNSNKNIIKKSENELKIYKK